jgi:hypothetical protein
VIVDENFEKENIGKMEKSFSATSEDDESFVKGLDDLNYDD